MKKIAVHFLFLVLSILIVGCNYKMEICECFELRLKVKNLMKEAENDSILEESEEFKNLINQKKECLTKIEPAYFEEKNIQRNGRNEEEFLLEELSDCQAVKDLLSVEEVE